MKPRASRIIRALATCILAMALPSAAQPTAKVHRIGMLSTTLQADTWRASPVYHAFLEGLRELGYVEGQNIAIEFRSSEGQPDALPGLAEELAGLRPAVVLVTVCGSPLDAMRRAGPDIPIVVGACTDDMVASGIVKSLGHPGGNVTGQQKLTPELSRKRLEMFSELAPHVSRVAVLSDPGYSGFPADWEALRVAAQTLIVTLLPVEARGPAEYEAAFATMIAQHAGGFITMQDANVFLKRLRLAELEAASGLPAVYPYRENVIAGGLASYGVSVPAMFRRSAAYIDKILMGAKPADLPVEQPTRFEMAVNLNVAKALGIAIPKSILLRADEVVE
jgi:ABC-type uncharacterized transport system substrate-binding protein